MQILVLSEREIQQAVSMPEAMMAVEGAFAALARGEARLPEVIGLEVPEVDGEIHVKGAHLQGAPYVVFKVATGFWQNPLRGLPTSSGLMMAFDAATGFPAALLLDNGYLTDLRTGAAGGVAANNLANPVLDKVAIIGSGVQARHQLRAVARVRELEGRVAVWSRSRENAQVYAREMVAELDVDVAVAADVRTALRNADLVITTTPSREPLIQGEWLSRGVHINAVGSDAPDKQELDVTVLARADIIVADRLSQCLRLGEIHHAVDACVINADDVAGELGEVIIGRAPGRTSEAQITVCDLTGVGVQDAAIASLVLEKAGALGLGTVLETA
jgi:ornithine cyclodeaminase